MRHNFFSPLNTGDPETEPYSKSESVYVNENMLWIILNEVSSKTSLDCGNTAYCLSGSLTHSWRSWCHFLVHICNVFIVIPRVSGNGAPLRNGHIKMLLRNEDMRRVNNDRKRNARGAWPGRLLRCSVRCSHRDDAFPFMLMRLSPL